MSNIWKSLVFHNFGTHALVLNFRKAENGHFIYFAARGHENLKYCGKFQYDTELDID